MRRRAASFLAILSLCLNLAACHALPMPQAVRDFFEKPVPGYHPWPGDPRPYSQPCCTLPPPRLIVPEEETPAVPTHREGGALIS